MIVVVGSTAANKLNLLNREAKDVDIWTDEEEIASLKKKGYDISLVPKYILEQIPTEFSYFDNGKKILVPTKDALYTIKLAHLGWDIFWEKHKRDVLVMKLLKGCKIIPSLYYTLVDHWRNTHGNKDFLSLYKDKTQFFNDYVDYIYPHDYLHELVAYPNKPIYTLCLKEGQEVAIDKTKFDSLTYEQQLRMFREEIVVIASERWLLNPKLSGRVSWQEAYRLSLRKTVTALTKNWATDFLLFNLEKYDKPVKEDFVHLTKILKI